MTPGAVRIGLDVGATKTDAVALNAEGTVVSHHRMPTLRGTQGVIETISRAVQALSEQQNGRPVASIGIGMPGQVAGGSVSHAVNLEIEEVELRAALEQRLQVPVHLENDVKAAAIGIHALRGRGSLAYLNLGTGIAAGVVLDGGLWRGAAGAAGEIGHLSIDPSGPFCRCGQRGCIEAFAGGAALAQRWSRTPFSIGDLFRVAAQGDEEADALCRGVVSAVAAAVRLLALTVDVETIVLGGGVATADIGLTDKVAAELRQAAESSAFLGSMRLDERIEVLLPDSSAPAVGAALLCASEDQHPEEQGVALHG